MKVRDKRVLVGEKVLSSRTYLGIITLSLIYMGQYLADWTLLTILVFFVTVLKVFNCSSTWYSILPNATLVNSVHGRPDGAVEVLCKLVHVGEGSLDPEHVWGMHPGHHPQLERFGPVLGAPNISCAHPEKLLLSVVEAW